MSLNDESDDDLDLDAWGDDDDELDFGVSDGEPSNYVGTK